jgi:hypothetical protein
LSDAAMLETQQAYGNATRLRKTDFCLSLALLAG